MKFFEFRSALWLPESLERIFAFFSDAHNLETLTPPWLHFRVLTQAPIEIQPGTRIDYHLRLRGLPLRWQSEITVWEPPGRFVDVQRRGPYRAWIHTHSFEGSRDGTLISDHVRYSVWGGALINSLLVAPDVRRIFKYRERRLRELFA